jgi:hypothetical protein
MIVRAEESSADPVSSADLRGEYEVTIHRASTRTTPPAMPALTNVRRVLFGCFRVCDLGNCGIKNLKRICEKRALHSSPPI